MGAVDEPLKQGHDLAAPSVVALHGPGVAFEKTRSLEFVVNEIINKEATYNMENQRKASEVTRTSIGL